MFDKEVFGNVCKDIITKDNEELFAKKEDELEDYWFFDFQKKTYLGLSQNYYEFFEALETYKHYCRRWEEHHNGHVCVVERVRDKYLMPKIKKFIKTNT